jgi:CRP-like cAMP-binding protein
MIGLDDLKRYSLFGGIMDKELALIRTLLKPEQFPPGHDIIHQGDRGDRLYFILEGEVEILVHEAENATRPDKRIAILGAGDTVGEMELIDIQPRTATVRALTQVHTVCLTNKDFFTIKKAHLETFTLIIMNLARDISRRLRVMDQEIVHRHSSSRLRAVRPDPVLRPSPTG